ncbi:MAG: GGDEF domain-containing protein, partial [Pseudomonadota bacterium]
MPPPAPARIDHRPVRDVQDRPHLDDAAVIDGLPLGLLLFQQGPDLMPVCVEANATFLNWCPHGETSPVGLLYRDVALIGGQNLIGRYIEACLAGDRAPAAELCWSLDDAGAEARHFSATLRRIGTRVLVSIRDRSAEIRAEYQLRLTMMSDELTGIPNRLQFTETVDRAIARRGDQHVAVIILNIDRFKRINDSLGHVVGDEFLIALARRLSGCVRDSDAIARIGGDEFALMMAGIYSDTDASDIAGRIGIAIDPGHHGGEFVAADAGDGVAVPDAAGQAAGERDQEFVA